MALCVCKCLNVTLESDKFEQNVDISKLELPSTEQRDIFFSEKLIEPVGNLREIIAQPVLKAQRTVGHWILHCCLACGQTTHAILQQKPNTTLVPKALQTNHEAINVLKKSNSFSSVFHLLVPEVTDDIEMKENIDTSNLLFSDRKQFLTAQQAMGTLNVQLSQTLKQHLEAMEESIRQFRDQKYAEFEAFREKAHRDHKILAGIISKTQGSIDNDSWRMDTSLENGPPSPLLPPLQRRRLSSIKDAKKILPPQNKQMNKHLPPEDDSLDAEDIFDFEGMDSRHDLGSDQDDYDSDNSGSHDEGIHIARARNNNNSAVDIARSLPINVPKFPMERSAERDLVDDDEPSHDIAASIKALAKSVHGDVFELPRPRFSTQI